MNKRVILAGILLASLVAIPKTVDARPISRAVSRPTTVSRPATRVTVPRVSTPKSSTPRPTKIKNGTSVMKPSSKTTSPSKTYTVKPKTTKTTTTAVSPSYYTNYPNSSVGISPSSNFWMYYGLTHMNRHGATEREVAKELEKKGYSKEEVDNILKDAKKEKKSKKGLMPLITMCALVISLILFVLFKVIF